MPFRTSDGMATTLKERVKWKAETVCACACEALSSTVIVIVVGAAVANATKSDAEKMVLDFILKERRNLEDNKIESDRLLL